MAQITANGISIEYDTFGSRSSRPLLLVMGLGAQLIHWRDEFCDQLADRDHFVIRYDNRDAGLSEKFGHLGTPDMMEIAGRLMAGEPAGAPYSLDDMAADAFGLLDNLDIEAAHICGASMGGSARLPRTAKKQSKELWRYPVSSAHPHTRCPKMKSGAALRKVTIGHSIRKVWRDRWRPSPPTAIAAPLWRLWRCPHW
jgi:hypothetical protein